MKTKHGEVMSLVWPDGNDDGELYIRGHLNDDPAKDTLLNYSDELEWIAYDRLEDDEKQDDVKVAEEARELIESARIERIYARWSQESGEDLGARLRTYKARGRGRFAVTRATLYPRPPCHLSVRVGEGLYHCGACGRRFVGPDEQPYNLTGPDDCERLVGDEVVSEFTTVYREAP